MKKILLIGLWVLILTACNSEVKTDETISKGEAELIKGDKPSYQLDLNFDPENHTISGTEMVAVKNTSDSDWNSVCFRDYPSYEGFQNRQDGGITDITNITIVYPSGKKATTDNLLTRDEKDNTIIYFKLEHPLKPNETLMLDFDLCVYIPKEVDRFGYSKFSYNLGYFFPILSIFEDGDWVTHPFFQEGECAYSESSTFEVKVTAPEGYTIITTGELQGVEGKVSTFYAKNVRDFTMVIGNNYEVTSREYNGININSYYVKGNEEGGEVALGAAVDSVKTYSSTVGAYPYDSLDIVETLLSGGGMEYPQIIMVNHKYYSGREDIGLGNVTAHEIAHQWFYGIVGNDQYDEAWIDEGFATFLGSVVYYEDVEPDYIKRWIGETVVSEEVFNNVSARDDLQALDQSVSDFSDMSIYSPTVYSRGSEFLVTLREFIGVEDFNSALQEIFVTYKFKIINTEAVLDIFQRNTEKDLTKLYDFYFS